MKNNYIVLYQKNKSLNLSYYMYKDLLSCEGITLCSRTIDSCNKYLHIIYSKLKEYVGNRKRGYKFIFRILDSMEEINNIKFSKNKTNVIFVNDQGLYPYDVDRLLKIKEREPNVVFVVQWLNAVSTVTSICYKEMQRLNPEYILTDDPSDARKYNWIFWQDCISNIDDIERGKKTNVFFAGIAKDREKKIIEAYSKMKKNDLVCDFTIVGGKEKKRGISNDYMEYRELISRDKGTDCILEIMQGGQEGYTCRAQEAIMLNKKLLTNNHWIKGSKYYNPNYIKIFDEIGDEEIQFIKNEIKVDYGYEGDFSPKYLIEYLDELI